MLPSFIADRLLVPSRLARREGGFSLIELIAGMAVILVLAGLATAAISGAKGNNLPTAVSEIAGALQLARTHAAPEVGRLVISMVASKDGTSIYPQSVPGGNVPATHTLDPVRLIQIGKLLVIDNIHVFAPPVANDEFGRRPGSKIGPADRIGLSQAGDSPLCSFNTRCKARPAVFSGKGASV